MLILTRHIDETVVLTLPGGARVTVMVVGGSAEGGVRLGFEAPAEVVIRRSELERRRPVQGLDGGRAKAPRGTCRRLAKKAARRLAAPLAGHGHPDDRDAA